MQVEIFDFDLDRSLIADKPANPRDTSRLLDLSDGEHIKDRHFYDLPDILQAGDVLVFNAADTQPDQDLPSSSELMERYQTEVASAMHCIELVRGKDFSDKKGCVLLTGGGLAMYPISAFIPLSVNKAALRTLAYCLHEKLKNENIFVGTVTICGTVGADQFFSPQNIAKAYWDLYEKRSNCEVVYAYPEIKDSEEAFPLNANHYWVKVGELKNSHDGE